MPSSVFTLSTRTAARTGSLNSGGVTGMFWSSKISMSAIFKGTLLSAIRSIGLPATLLPQPPCTLTSGRLEDKVN